MHSSAHDKRRHKRIARLLKKNKKELEQACKKIITSYFCEADALAAAQKLSQLPKKTDCYLIETSIKKKPKYRPGRPKAGEHRVPENFEFPIEIKIVEDEDKLKRLRYEAGCFVLISNLNTAIDNLVSDLQVKSHT